MDMFCSASLKANNLFDNYFKNKWKTEKKQFII